MVDHSILETTEATLEEQTLSLVKEESLLIRLIVSEDAETLNPPQDNALCIEEEEGEAVYALLRSLTPALYQDSLAEQASTSHHAPTCEIILDWQRGVWKDEDYFTKPHSEKILDRLRDDDKAGKRFLDMRTPRYRA